MAELEPKTRKELFYQQIVNKTDELEPKTREEKWLTAIANSVSGGDGSSQANLGEKSITENGTYIAADDNLDGYRKVAVNVPSAKSRVEGIDGTLGNIFGSMAKYNELFPENVLLREVDEFDVYNAFYVPHGILIVITYEAFTNSGFGSAPGIIFVSNQGNTSVGVDANEIMLALVNISNNRLNRLYYDDKLVEFDSVIRDAPCTTTIIYHNGQYTLG